MHARWRCRSPAALLCMLCTLWLASWSAASAASAASVAASAFDAGSPDSSSPATGGNVQALATTQTAGLAEQAATYAASETASEAATALQDKALRKLRARAVAADLDMHFARPVGELPDYFLRDSDANHRHQLAALERRAADHARVLWFETQLPRRRLFKRELLDAQPLADQLAATSPVRPDAESFASSSKAPRGPPIRIGDITEKLGIKDPRFSDQWHLFNAPEPGHDMNITGVWLQGITGKNITVGFIDDGLDLTNPDLADNFSLLGSFDFNYHKKDPMPTLSDDTHGTRCAGEVAAVKNNVCGVGVAWDAKVAGRKQVALTMEAPPDIVTQAVYNGIVNGRQGLGSIYVFAAGNGGVKGDNCNYDGYTNSIYTITVAAVDRYEGHPAFSEPCPANLISMWSGRGGFSGIVTTDWKEGCTDKHGGTSAAAPLAAGVYALVLSIRPDLTWRDLQQLTVNTAYPVNQADPDWLPTAAGRLFNHKYGYGTLDSYAIVEAAKTFTKLNPQVNITIPTTFVEKEIPAKSADGISYPFTITPDMVNAARFYRLEHVTVTVDITHERRGDVAVSLRSPKTRFDEHMTGFLNWTMMTVMHWDEDVLGEWTVVVTDNETPEKKGVWHSWSAIFWGEGRNATTQTQLPPAVSSTALPSVLPSSSALPSQSTARPSPSPSPSPAQPATPSPTEPAAPSPTPSPTPSPIDSSESQKPQPDTAYVSVTVWGWILLLTLIVAGVYVAFRRGLLKMPLYAPVRNTDRPSADEYEFGELLLTDDDFGDIEEGRC
ncbi:peptidase S8/S53 domain-containing protein [Entophlyctis helioformis]|nr:peptidase S8/S53 domain-containing protein [Entophlyctis helioformis]